MKVLSLISAMVIGSAVSCGTQDVETKQEKSDISNIYTYSNHRTEDNNTIQVKTYIRIAEKAKDQYCVEIKKVDKADKLIETTVFDDAFSKRQVKKAAKTMNLLAAGLIGIQTKKTPKIIDSDGVRPFMGGPVGMVSELNSRNNIKKSLFTGEGLRLKQDRFEKVLSNFNSIKAKYPGACKTVEIAIEDKEAKAVDKLVESN